MTLTAKDLERYPEFIEFKGKSKSEQKTVPIWNEFLNRVFGCQGLFIFNIFMLNLKQKQNEDHIVIK